MQGNFMGNNATIYGLIFSYGMAWAMSSEGITPFLLLSCGGRRLSFLPSIRARLDVGGGA